MSGLRPECKDCTRKAARAWYQVNKGRRSVQYAKWKALNLDRLREHWRERSKDPLRRRVNELKKRAKGSVTGGYIGSLLRMQKGKCVICFCAISGGYHVDHIMPIALGGNSDKQNLQLLCPPCNIAKGAKHPVAYMQSLGRLL